MYDPMPVYEAHISKCNFELFQEMCMAGQYFNSCIIIMDEGHINIESY